MLDNKGFDLWADDYDQSVGIGDEQDSYPFAGYKKLLGKIYQIIRQGQGTKVLDIGFGTATLSNKLYQNGYEIWGQDFSQKMIEIASPKMPNAHLFQGDFTKDLHKEISNNNYDFIIATYALHHLTDKQKAPFINNLKKLLNPKGLIIIGDVAFETQAQLDNCCQQAGDNWDEDEFYFVYEQLKQELTDISFEKISNCAGIIQLSK